MLLVELGGIEPPSRTPFIQLHTTILFFVSAIIVSINPKQI
jgi:hypothetical protein